MRLLIATDAWFPQVNGVVRTLDKITQCLRSHDHKVGLLTHEGRKTFALPGYREIKLAWISQVKIGQAIDQFNADSIHIATEGPIGWAVRRWCIVNKKNFTTSFHTQFAEYVALRIPLPGIKSIGYSILRRFHKHSCRVLTPTPAISDLLKKREFKIL